jgi:predicted transcriptional regulator of viral defense system
MYRINGMHASNAWIRLEPLLKRHFFTARQARDLGVPSSMLCYYVRIGRLRRVERGVYQSVDYENSELFKWEPLIDAVQSIQGGVICLISALAVYDLTEETPRQAWVAIRHGTSAKRKSGVRVVRYRNLQLGKTEIELEGVSVPIFDRERTIVDAFRYLSREAAIKALKAAIAQRAKLDLVKLQEYAKELRVDIVPYLMSITT